MEAPNSQQQQMPPPPSAPPQQQPQMPQPPQPPGGDASSSGRGGGGRGRGGRGNSRGGRTGAGGRTLVDPNKTGRGGRGGGRGGRGSGEPGTVQKIAANTGIPYGHVPAYLPGSSSLVEELDQRIMIVLRDGRHLVGNLRTFDQYSNMVLDNASERRFHSNEPKDGETNKINYYTDVPLGMYIVRGDSIVLLGQVGSEEEEASNPVPNMTKLDNEAFDQLVEDDQEAQDNNAEEESDTAGAKSLEWDFDKDLLA